MKQSIVALIRPNLNLSQKESQASHLIEHVLVAPKRLEALGISANFYAKNIIYHSGAVNDFYLAEYYIVRSEATNTVAKILLKHQNELYLDHDDFRKIKSPLVEELHENRGEFIGTGEQLSKAIYLPGSPTIQNPWDDFESIINLSFNETIKIFHKYNTNLTLLQLSFDNYKIDRLPVIERNSLRKPDGMIELTHPWQSPGCLDFSHIVPLHKNVDFLESILYRRSLTDLRFGLLQDELRSKQGLVYDISIDADYNNNNLEIYFSSSEENSHKVASEIKISLEKYEPFIQNNIDYIKRRLRLEFELDWGDIQNLCLGIIDRVISGGFTETPASLIKRMEAVTVQDLSKLNRLFLSSLNHEAISVKRRHGKNLTTKINNKKVS